MTRLVKESPNGSTVKGRAERPGGRSDLLKHAVPGRLVIEASVCSPAILPGNPPEPCPELLTEDEAIRYLRIDTIDIANPSETLRGYRGQGVLRATQVSKKLFYRRVELDRFLERITDQNPR